MYKHNNVKLLWKNLLALYCILRLSFRISVIIVDVVATYWCDIGLQRF